MGDDIIAEMPWCCGEKDCPVQWHQSNYWAGDGEYTVDNYADGDHEECEGSEVPGYEEQQEAWRSYACHVVEFGTDPLGQYHAPDTYKEKQTWQFWFEPSPVGTVVTRARRAGQERQLTDVPERMLSYLGIDLDHWSGSNPVVMPDEMGLGMGAEKLYDVGCCYFAWSTLTADVPIERDPELVKTELRRLARKHLRKLHYPLWQKSSKPKTKNPSELKNLRINNLKN